MSEDELRLDGWRFVRIPAIHGWWQAYDREGVPQFRGGLLSIVYKATGRSYSYAELGIGDGARRPPGPPSEMAPGRQFKAREAVR